MITHLTYELGQSYIFGCGRMNLTSFTYEVHKDTAKLTYRSSRPSRKLTNREKNQLLRLVNRYYPILPR